MSIPHSNVLSCSRGVLSKVDVNSSKHSEAARVTASPNLNNNNNINLSQTIFIPDNNNVCKYNSPYENTQEINRNVDNVNISRNVDTAQTTLDELENIIKNKDLLIQAMVLILDIYENNPLIINKYCIPDENVLIKLIQLLTNSSNVELYKLDPEVNCTCKIEKYDVISKIMVKKDDQIYNLKYSFPDVIEFLLKHKISTKFVKINY